MMHIVRPSRFLGILFVFGAGAVVACGGDSTSGGGGGGADKFGSAPGVTTVIGNGKGGQAYVTPDGADDCLDILGECVKPQEKCGEGSRADVIVDSNGKVVEVVCYPGDDAPPVVDGEGDVDLDKQNKGVVAVDGIADGVDIEGNVTAAGNNVTVYGEGPDVSVLGGDVTATGNNFSMRGVTVKGDVAITANNGTLVLAVIEGDVVYTGNNFVMAETVVLGNVTITGNNAKLLGNSIAGTLTVNGKESLCDGNRQRLADGALGDPLTCN